MKRKYANRPGWNRIVEKSYKCIFVDDENFNGHIAQLSLTKVREPLWISYETKKLCIVDDHYVWLQFFPVDEKYMLTVTYDATGKLVQYYFDFVRKNGLTVDGIPYCEDLYLDIVVLPSGEIITLDEDELQNAFEQGMISREEYESAILTGDRLKESILSGTNDLINRAAAYVNLMKSY